MNKDHKTIPCKQCPVFVLCLDRDIIKCKRLFEFMYEDPEEYVPYDPKYTRVDKESLATFNKVYNKYVRSLIWSDCKLVIGEGTSQQSDPITITGLYNE